MMIEFSFWESESSSETLVLHCLFHEAKAFFKLPVECMLCALWWMRLPLRVLCFLFLWSDATDLQSWKIWEYKMAQFNHRRVVSVWYVCICNNHIKALFYSFDCMCCILLWIFSNCFMKRSVCLLWWWIMCVKSLVLEWCTGSSFVEESEVTSCLSLSLMIMYTNYTYG